MKNLIQKITTIIAVLCVSIAAVAKDYSSQLTNANTYLSNGNTAKAENIFKYLLELTDISDAQRAEAQKGLSRCQNVAHQEALSRQFRSSVDTIKIPAEGIDDFEVTISGSTWSIVKDSYPEYMSLTRAGDKVLVSAKPNYDKPREGRFAIKMNGRTDNYVYYIQPVVTKQITIKTIPITYQLSIDNELVKPNQVMTVSANQHHIVKPETTLYAGIDTLIDVRTIGDDMILPLRPKFALLRIKFPDGYLFNTNNMPPRITVNDKMVNTDYLTSIDAPEIADNPRLEFNHMYKDYKVPIREGRAHLRITDDQLENYERQYTVRAGDSIIVSDLKLNLGTVLFNVRTDGSPHGINVLVDDQPINATTEDQVKVVVGQHRFSFHKKDYAVFHAPDTVTVGRNPVTINITMHPIGYLDIKGSPDAAVTLVNGRHLKKTENGFAYAKAGKTHIEIIHEGYAPLVMDTTLMEGETLKIDYDLPKLYPYELKCDENLLNVRLFKDGERLFPDSTYWTTNKSALMLYIPEGKYDLRLYRNGKTAYKTKIENSSKSRSTRILSYSHWYFNFVAGEYYFVPVAGKWHHAPTENIEAFAGKEFPMKSYSMFAQARLMQFKLFPGLTTALAKAAFFKAANDVNGAVIPGDDVRTDTSLPSTLLGFSCIFLNEDFRLGGALHPNVDVSMLTHYTWYPPLKTFVPMSHFDGHEVFVGLEVSSRLPIFNANVRAGVSILEGSTNFYRSRIDKNTSKNIKAGFESARLSSTAFTVAIGFTLGTKDSKGQNILRIF